MDINKAEGLIHSAGQLEFYAECLINVLEDPDSVNFDAITFKTVDEYRQHLEIMIDTYQQLISVR